MYQIIPQQISQSTRKTVNAKILLSIEGGNTITAEDVYNQYTGIGGLHELKQADFSSYRDYALAKREAEMGQFFTPHNICRQMVEAINPQPDEMVLDMCCGMGNFFNFLPNQHNAYGFDIDPDAVRVAKHEDMCLFLTYPGLGNAMVDEQIRRTINQYRFGNRLQDDFKITIDDLAMCYATFEEINHEEYVRQLMKGIFTNSKSLFKGTGMTAEKFREHNLSIIMSPCKHLYIFKDDREFLKELDGKVYAITDLDDKFICDVLEEDMIALEDKGIIAYNQILSADSIELIRSSRVEIIILTKPTKR